MIGFYDKSLEKMLSGLASVTGLGSFTKALDGYNKPMMELSKSLSSVIGKDTFSTLKQVMPSMSASIYTQQKDILQLSSLLKANAAIMPVLDKKMFYYNNELSGLTSALQMYSDSLRGISALSSRYDAIINQQKESFQTITSLRPYEKRYLLNHEKKQKSTLLLSENDISNSPIVESNVINTVSLISSISGTSDANVYSEHDRSIEEDLYAVLQQQGAGYLQTIEGAKEAAKSNNPDKIRHTIVSLRELATHVLHDLSPVCDVKRWNSSPDNYVNGNPTRKCRLEYIFRNTQNSTIRSFIENEIKFIKDLFDELNAGTHSLLLQLTDDELFYLITKTESTILLLLKYSSKQ